MPLRERHWGNWTHRGSFLGDLVNLQTSSSLPMLPPWGQREQLRAVRDIRASLEWSSANFITHGPSSGGISGLMAPPLLQGYAGPIAAIGRSSEEDPLFLLTWPDVTVL